LSRIDWLVQTSDPAENPVGSAIEAAAEGCLDGEAGPLPRLLPFLSPAERETLATLRYPKRRREWLLGRWTAKQLLQRSLGGYGELALTAISVEADPDGAPYLSVEGEGRLPASLSISHRGGRAVCALSPALSPAIGVDLEQVEPRSEAFVEGFFTPAEAARAWAILPERRDTLVTAIWSAKEAVLKALREGLRIDTRAVEVRHVAGLDARERVPEERLPPLALHRVGADLASVDWQPVHIESALPGALRIAAWWRPESDSVLTMAAVWP
jgi:4'-phosphopantetheinyl transferase